MTTSGHSVLVVEDEYFIADDMAAALQSEGITVIGPVSSDEEALRLIRQREVHGAILDINLNGTVSPNVAEALRAEGIPFLFVTGYDAEALGPEFEGATLLRKPVAAETVIAKLAPMLDQRAMLGA